MSGGDNGIADTSDVEELDEEESFSTPDIIVLEDDEGNEHEFALLAIVDVQDQDYALLTTIDDLQDEEGESMELFLFKYEEEEDGAASFSEIEDEETYIRVRDFCATLVEMDEVNLEEN
jgi:uncharacterized protein YrzB (UPF0473 family)